VEQRQRYDCIAATAIATLGLLDGEQLVDTVRRAARLCGARNQDELRRVLKSSDPLDHALYFLHLMAAGRPIKSMQLVEARNCKGPWGLGSRRRIAFSGAISAPRN